MARKRTARKIARGTTAQHSTFTGRLGELTYDTDKKMVVVHDASTAGGIPTDYTLNVKRYGAKGDGATTDTAAFAAALLLGGDIHVPAGTYLLGQLTVSVAKTRLICAPGVTLSFPTLGANKAAITVSANAFSVVGFPKVQGPSSGVYVAGEDGISMVGSSSASRKSGLYVEAEFANFGSAGVYAKWVDDIQICPTSYAHDCGYIGFGFVSCNRGKVIGVRVKTISPGTGGNAYGITVTHDSTGYSGDPNAGTKQALNPFCQDWDILSNIVEETSWVGIDAHGGYNIRANFNKVYNTKGGIHIASGSGDAANYSGWDNEVCYNVVDTRKSDGTAGSTANLGIGINMGATGTTVRGQRLRCVGNVVRGYGIVSNAGGTPSISVANTDGVVVQGNVVESWGGVGITMDDAQNAVVDGNVFLQLANAADTVAIAIRNQTASAVRQTVINNVLDANGGTAAKEGFRTAATLRPFLNGNNFIAATSAGAVTTYASNFHIGADLPAVKIKDFLSAGGSTTLDLSEFAYGQREITVTLTAAAPISITNITGVPVMTKVTLVVLNGSSAITFTRDNAALAGPAVWVGTGYNTLTLLGYALSGSVRWVEISRTTTNG